MRSDQPNAPPSDPVLVVLRERSARDAVASALASLNLDAMFADDAAAAVEWLHDR